ncbi:MAG: PaaX family transcriptional regulator C-terminal domain-containing protein, partial [Pseudorhodoplanes sp.]
LLIESGAGKQPLVLRSPAEPRAAADALRDLLDRSWDMKRLAEDYKTFLDTFRPVWQRLGAAEKLDPQTCFAVRTLLMHAYRRVLLRDPKLPDELLPAHWPGTASRLLCRDLYRLIQRPAEQHLMTILQTADGAVPPADPSYFTRFGGLPPLR